MEGKGVYHALFLRCGKEKQKILSESSYLDVGFEISAELERQGSAQLPNLSSLALPSIFVHPCFSGSVFCFIAFYNPVITFDKWRY